MKNIPIFKSRFTKQGNFFNSICKKSSLTLCTELVELYFPHTKNIQNFILEIRKSPCKKKGERKFGLSLDGSFTDVVINRKTLLLMPSTGVFLKKLMQKHSLTEIYVSIK